jgi:hypothetical protein
VAPLAEADAQKRDTPPGVKQALRKALVKFPPKLSPIERKRTHVLYSRVQHIRRLFRSKGNDYNVTDSHYSDPPIFANDGLFPLRSRLEVAPRPAEVVGGQHSRSRL